MPLLRHDHSRYLVVDQTDDLQAEIKPPRHLDTEAKETLSGSVVPWWFFDHYFGEGLADENFGEGLVAAGFGEGAAAAIPLEIGVP